MQVLFQVFEACPPDSTWLSESFGEFEGQVVFILHPNGDIQAHQWGGKYLRWVNIGQYSYGRQRIEGLLERDKLRGQKIGGGLPPNTLQYFRAVAKQREEDYLAMVAESPQARLTSHPGSLQTNERHLGAIGDFWTPNLACLAVSGVSSQGIPGFGYHGYATLPPGVRSSFADDPFVTPMIGSPGGPTRLLPSTTNFDYVTANQGLDTSRRPSVPQSYKPDEYGSGLSLPSVGTGVGNQNLRAYSEVERQSSSPGHLSGYTENIYQRIPRQHMGQAMHQIRVPHQEETHASPGQQGAVGHPMGMRFVPAHSGVDIGRGQEAVSTTAELDQVTSDVTSTLGSTATLEIDDEAELDQMSFLDLEQNDHEHRRTELKALVQSSSRESAIPVSRSLRDTLLQAKGTATSSLEPASSDGVDRTPFDLDEWWNSGYNTRRRQEDYLKAVQKTLQKDSAESSTPQYSADPALYAVFENMLVYVEETLGQKPRHYFARFKKPPAWCIDTSPEGNNSFFGEDYGAPPARVGRVPRYRDPPAPIGFEYQMRRAGSARNPPRLFDTYYNPFVRRS